MVSDGEVHLENCTKNQTCNIAEYDILAYQYIHNFSNSYSTSGEASDIY